jgi:hypothetical protein
MACVQARGTCTVRHDQRCAANHHGSYKALQVGYQGVQGSHKGAYEGVQGGYNGATNARRQHARYKPRQTRKSTKKAQTAEPRAAQTGGARSLRSAPTCSSSRGLLRTRRSMSSSFRLLEHPPMPADLHISMRSVLVLFPRVSRSCSGTDVVMVLPVPAVAASCTLRAH